jgi:hypothetical protein
MFFLVGTRYISTFPSIDWIKIDTASGGESLSFFALSTHFSPKTNANNCGPNNNNEINGTKPIRKDPIAVFINNCLQLSFLCISSIAFLEKICDIAIYEGVSA